MTALRIDSDTADFSAGGMFMEGMSFGEMILRLVLAVLIGGTVGIEREYKNRPAGMRTHVLVCLGACLIAVLDCLMASGMLNAQSSVVSTTFGRISAQVISGVGFLGAGTIFMAQKHVAGLTTAASLWCVACIGLAVGMGYYLLSVSACIIMLLVLHFAQNVIHPSILKAIELDFIHRDVALPFVEECFRAYGVQMRDLNVQIERTKECRVYRYVYTVTIRDSYTYVQLMTKLSESENIIQVRTRST